MHSKRSSGILLHPTSLPGPLGAGDFGADAYRFVEWLAAAGQSLWQMLPLGPPGQGHSPYMCSSAFAGNPLLIDLVDLQHRGWLDSGDVPSAASDAGQRIDYAAQIALRLTRLRRAAARFFAGRGRRALSEAAEAADDYATFCRREQAWLDDYALFMALDARHGGKFWSAWPARLAQRNAAALGEAASEHADEIAFWKFCQWIFAAQWQRLRDFANSHGVRIVGDVPIFVAYHSADVWAAQALFELDNQGRQTVVAGVPPDYFSATGQRWGNPLYRWSAHQADGFQWWRARMRRAFALADIVRIDHFRGLAAYWEIPAGEASAINGRWVPAPGRELLTVLKADFPELPVIAEDLGIITPDVERLRDDFELPGMRILQFAFAGDASHAYLPHNYTRNTVAYTGTHDNDTCIGWWRGASARERDFAQHYLASDGSDIHWRMMRAASASVADMVVFPLQDVLELDRAHRMNIPGSESGNWAWRFSWPQVHEWHARVLREMTATYGRGNFSGLPLRG